jgi:hypothetical protein
MIDGFKMRLEGADQISAFLTKHKSLEKSLKNRRTTSINNSGIYIDDQTHHKDPKLIIRGSLVRLDDKRHYEDFKFSELNTAIDRLQNLLQYDVDKFTLYNLEIGCNTQLPIGNREFMNSLLRVKGQVFRFVGRQENTLHAFLKEYMVKIYNKTRVSRLKTKSIIRAELVLNCHASLKRCGVHSFRSIQEETVIRKLSDIFKKYISKIESSEIMDYAQMSKSQINTYCKAIHEPYKLSLNKHERSRLNRQLNKLRKRFCIESNTRMFQTLISVKTNKLLNT